MATTSVKVTILAVGQGMGNLIEVYEGTNMTQLILVDCGGSGVTETHVKDCIWKIHAAMQKRAKALGKTGFYRHIDLLVLSHQDRDHHSILYEILKKQTKAFISIGEFWTFDENYCTLSADYKQCRDKIVEIAGKQCILPDGSAYENGALAWHLYASDYACLTYLYTNARGGDSRNTVSAVIQLELRFPGKFVYRFLFPGDPTKQTMEQISSVKLPGDYEIDYMSAPHHGSIVTCDSSSLTAFLEKMKVREVVVSAGEGNGYGHPHKTFMEIAENKIRCTIAAHSCYYNTTDKAENGHYGIKSTTKRLYTSFVPDPTARGRAVRGEYYHYVYTMSSSGMKESLEGIERHSGSPYTLTERSVQENSRPWRAVAMPGGAM